MVIFCSTWYRRTMTVKYKYLNLMLIAIQRGQLLRCLLQRGSTNYTIWVIHSLSDSVAWTQVQLFISSCYCDLISIVSLNYVLFYRQSQYYVHLIEQQACVAIVSEKYHTAVHLLLLKDRISIQYLNILQPKYLYICCRWSIITIIMLFAFSDSPNNPNYSENNRKMVDFLKHIYH